MDSLNFSKEEQLEIKAAIAIQMGKVKAELNTPYAMHPSVSRYRQGLQERYDVLASILHKLREVSAKNDSD